MGPRTTDTHRAIRRIYAPLEVRQAKHSVRYNEQQSRRYLPGRTADGVFEHGTTGRIASIIKDSDGSAAEGGLKRNVEGERASADGPPHDRHASCHPQNLRCLGSAPSQTQC